jgi:hypothetical protein
LDLVVDYFGHFFAAAPGSLLHVTFNVARAGNLKFFSLFATANRALEGWQSQNLNIN